MATSSSGSAERLRAAVLTLGDVALSPTRFAAARNTQRRVGGLLTSATGGTRVRLDADDIRAQARLLRRRVRGGGVEVGLTLIVREALSGLVLPGSPAASRGGGREHQRDVGGRND